ncbi:glycosyltransferase family 1 protein [Alcanivorax sp. JB21]|uniref:glycosyltransferase family 4 protein n=1 Tax=Alcanivorax limicola TaxID=2874102 RepID=UPI001CBACA4E|nr:glycosyltransferase family 1 protein [Alcanivorax limicola]MBZ2190240.1 glycosyltransferase family 1 protein [Alcanivorax limicola]
MSEPGRITRTEDRANAHTDRHYAIVTETYPPEINGVALTVRNLANGLRARGHRVTVIRPRQAADGQPGNDPATGQNTATDITVPGMKLPRYPGLQFGLPAGGKLRRLWREQPPDAIYVATEGPLGWSAVNTARQLGIPVATGLHTRFDEYTRDYGLGFLQGIAFAWMRWFHNRANATLVPTGELATFLSARGFRQAVHLPRAVDPQRFSPTHRDAQLRQRWGLADDDLAVIYVGRIAAEKNLGLAVRAFRAIQTHQPRARFIWVGEGPQRAALAEANPDFIFCGLQLHQALATHFASGDLFLFPSRSETFGNVTLEAMASGVATVAFHYGAAREHLRNGLHGAAVDTDEAFVEAAVALARQPQQRQHQGRAASAAMQRLHPDQVAANFDALLNGLGARRTAREEVSPCN